MRTTLLAMILLSFAAGSAAAEPPAVAAFFVEPVTQRTLDRLPPGPLFWRVEAFASQAEAADGAGTASLVARIAGRHWRFTLGPAGDEPIGGRFVARIGPVPRFEAPRYLLQVNRAGGPPGARTPVHRHPGSEAFLVLAGELSQRTAHGTMRVRAGENMNGHEPGAVMQLTSSGARDLEQIVLFVVDASRPFSTPADFR